MSRFIAATKNFVRDEEGATAVEYALMIALIAAVIVAAVTSLGNNAKARFEKAATDIGTGAVAP